MSGLAPVTTLLEPTVAFASELLALSTPDAADVTGANAPVVPVSAAAVLVTVPTADVTVDAAG